jgi:hypothetical protein
MDITKREKRNPRSTLFEKLILQENNWENDRTSLPLTAGHRGRRRRGGERPEGLPERRVREGRDGDRGIATGAVSTGVVPSRS